MAKATHKTKHTQKTTHHPSPKPQIEEPQPTNEETTNQASQPINQETNPPILHPQATTQSSLQPQTADDNLQEITENIETQPTSDNITSPETETSSQVEATKDKSLNNSTDVQEKPTTEETKIPDQELFKEDKSKKPLIAIIIILITIFIAAFYYFYFIKNSKPLNSKPKSAAVTQTIQSSPTPSPTSLNRDSWTLEVLNGSSKKGAAAALSEKLSAKGYKIIKTANAPEDVTSSQILFSESLNSQADLFIQDIKDELPNPSNAGILTDSTASARIIIGAE